MVVEEYVTIDDNLLKQWAPTGKTLGYSGSRKDKAKRPIVLVTLKQTKGHIAQFQQYLLWAGFTVVPGYIRCGYVKESSIRALRATL